MPPSTTVSLPSSASASRFLGIDPMSVVSFVRRRARLFLATALVFFALIVGYTLQLTPRYTANADVLISVGGGAQLNLENIIVGLSGDNNSVDTQAQILQSRSLAERVVRKLALQNDPEFNPTLLPPKPSLLQRLGLAKTPPPALRANQDSPVIRNAIAGRLLSGLSVQRQGLTYIMSVSYTASSRQKAALIANAFASEYIVDQLEAKYAATKTVNDWLNDRLGSLQRDVVSADAQVQQYKISQGLLSAQGATNAETVVGVLAQQIAEARADLATKRALLNTTRSQLQSGDLSSVSAALGSGTISALRSQETQQSQALAQLKARYTERHPQVLSAQSSLDETQQRIRDEINRIVAGQQADVDVAQQRVSSLAASQGSAQGALAGNNRAQVGLAQLERTSDANRAIYESLLNKSKESAGDAGIQQPDARILSEARQAWQSFPNLTLAILFGFVAGVFFGSCAVIIAELFETGFTTAQAVERRLKVAHLASLSLAPRSRRPGKPEDYLIDNPFSAFAESYRNLRASILLDTSQHSDHPIIAICSSLPGEGKTVTSACIMRTAAVSGGSVVLVDADLRSRGLSKKFTPNAVGLVEVLNGTATIDEALVLDAKSGGYVLPVVGPPESGEDIVGTSKMDDLLAELRKRFDLVIVDTPPVLALAEARLLSVKVDAVVFIVRWRKTPSRAAEIGLATLKSSGANVLGVALSQVNLDSQRSFGYGDSSYYYDRYRSYYMS
ncbi:MAG: hypothetical protein BGN86_03470 [Caulobacterales bacterium 68-7]|nr:MAG: hypothetical protein BGN86_03470 [Caulobacterales bacterium 68-7]